MNDLLESMLQRMSATQLVSIVLASLDRMKEVDRINFVAKYIDAHISLLYLGNDNPKDFLNEVNVFKLDIMNKLYYSDEDEIEDYFSNSDYNNYYDDDYDYDEYYTNTEWAETFSKLFELSCMYLRSSDVMTGYDACTTLLNCLIEAMNDESIFGTTEPDNYIDVGWTEIFSLYYKALFICQTDNEEAIRVALQMWIHFGNMCTDEFLANVNNIEIAEKHIFKEIENGHRWKTRTQCFTLLEQLYLRLGIKFDKVGKAKALLGISSFFYQQIIEGLYEQQSWQELIGNAKDALVEIALLSDDTTDYYENLAKKKIQISIGTMLTDAYERLMQYDDAFETVEQMFKEGPDFKLYIRARNLAEKTIGIDTFIERIELQLSTSSREYIYFGQSDLLLCIYSYEGLVEKLLSRVQLQKIGYNYYARKYVALSLVYRALEGVSDVEMGILTYLDTAVGQEGIVGMLNREDSIIKRSEILLSSVHLLKEMIEFHIDAAKRTRYAKAAYYMCVIRDIYCYLKREDEFREYFENCIRKNSRRPALRDEMSIVLRKKNHTP